PASRVLLDDAFREPGGPLRLLAAGERDVEELVALFLDRPVQPAGHPPLPVGAEDDDEQEHNDAALLDQFDEVRDVHGSGTHGSVPAANRGRRDGTGIGYAAARRRRLGWTVYQPSSQRVSSRSNQRRYMGPTASRLNRSMARARMAGRDSA